VHYEDNDQKDHNLEEETWEVLRSHPKLVQSHGGVELDWSPLAANGNTGYKGVDLEGDRQYKAYVPGRRGGNQKEHIGTYSSAVEAAAARAKRLHRNASAVAITPPSAALPAARRAPRGSTTASSALVPACTSVSATAQAPPQPPPAVPKLHAPTRDLFASLDGFEESVRTNSDPAELLKLSMRLATVIASVNGRMGELAKDKEMDLHACD
jgi:hypothetical protein